ncbi:putative F-box/LRR-repeat protein 9 [Bidens hawaiensis]|uniref:putative F-box/LRR-repeat protein 9 n=1 Tax=Bidens hawaiensis TaxID=980011 RepID=UPI004049736C
MEPTKNWLELPPDITVNILHRIGVEDILENAQKVCIVWREVCKDPALWRVVCVGRFPFQTDAFPLHETCKEAVDRSQGQLLDLTIIGGYCNPELLQYVADSTNISQEDIEALGRYCPLLKTLKLNHKPYLRSRGGKGDDEVPLAIGKHLPELTHLQLIQNCMTNIGLEAILDGCRHLESLDLSGYLYLDLKGDLGVPPPNNETHDVLDDSDDEYDGYHDYHMDDCDNEYDGYHDYDLDDNDAGSADLENLSERMASMDMCSCCLPARTIFFSFS